MVEKEGATEAKKEKKLEREGYMANNGIRSGRDVNKQAWRSTLIRLSCEEHAVPIVVLF